jgi:hypothetical protein
VLNYRQKTGCCPLEALKSLCRQEPKTASFLDKNNNVNNEQLKAEKALLLLTGQVESDRLRNWSDNIKRGTSSTFDKRPTIRVKKWNFNNKKSNNNSNAKGASSNNNHLNLRPLFPGEGNIVQRQLLQLQRVFFIYILLV